MRAGFGRACAALAAAVLGGVWVAGCTPQPRPGQPAATAASHVMALTPVAFDSLPGWRADRLNEALPPFLAGCAQIAAAPESALGGSGEAAARGGTEAEWRAACNAGRAVPPGDEAGARAFFQTWFQPFAVSDNGSRQGLFTGYYEPEVRGSRSPVGEYHVPLLGRPNDLVQVNLGDFSSDLEGRRLTGRVDGGRLVPYYDRASIVRGALERRRLDLLWLSDPIDAFFLQIQGSGRVRLPDGRVVRVTYAGQNGRPYVPVGRVLADRAQLKLEQVSMQTIRLWLESHPAEAEEVMDQNPSYVFFRELPDTPPDRGPPGALGVALTPMRSAAVDRDFIPLGAPLWVDTTDAVDGSPIRRLLLAQDLGGAIRGPVRADIFFGWSAEAAAHAGAMRQAGAAYVLLPRQPVAGQ